MQEINRETLQMWLEDKKDFVLVEALPPKSFREEHLPGAVNIPAEDDQFEAKAKQAIPDKDMTVVVYCANTECPASPKAGKKLEELGYTDVYDYVAGKQDWQEAGNELRSEAA